jgi:hypothetical protein
MRLRRPLATGLVAGATLLATCCWAGAPTGAQSGADQVAQGVAAPAPTSLSPSCSIPDPTRTLGPSAALPADPATTIVKPSGGIYTVTVDTDGVYVVNGSGLSVYGLDGSTTTSWALPAALTGYGDNGISQPVVDPDGNVYISSYYGQTVDAFSPSGTLLWSVDPAGGNPTNIFPVISSSGAWELAVSDTQDSSSSDLYSAAGAPAGTTTLWGAYGSTFTAESNGDLLYSSGQGLIQTWSPDGSTMLDEWGSPDTAGSGAHTGGAFQFYYAGQAAEGPDGDIYTADPLDTLTVTSTAGLLQGATTMGGGLDLEPDGGLWVVGQDVYVDAGAPFTTDSAVEEIPISTVQEYLAAPAAPLDTLGWGAGLATPADGNYFAPGQTPTVTADFASWWTQLAPQVQLRYSVWTDASMTAERVPASTTVTLPTDAAGLASVSLPLPAADTVPGPYQVRAELWDTATSPATLVSSTCLPYTVGAPGDHLDLSTLPSGLGAGGPTDPRGVALNSQLGLDGLRGATIDWSDFLPDCNASAPTAATCGPSAMTFTDAPESYFQAAYLAAQDNVTYWVQVTGGDPTSQALVDNDWWQGDIESLVGYYSVVPSGCTDCAAVTGWEPWNEANNTGWSDAASYVSQVLQPFYAGVKAADPSATVIGGSSLGVALGWWQQLIAAGGLADLDVVAIHPYPGNNDAWEEDGIPGQIKDLEGLIGSHPVWITEVGWWSDGDYNYLHQADAVTRAMLWQKVLHIPVWSYFFDEGNFGNDGVTFSLIQTGAGGDDYVKPAALATMVTANLTSDRSYLSMPSTGIPQAHDARFGASPTDPGDVDALWSDDLPVTASVTVTSPGGGTVPVTVTSEYGDTRQLALQSGTGYALRLCGQVRYVSYPEGDTLRVRPAESYGANLALASVGATATASSGDASAAIAGLAATTGEGQGWSSAPGDTDPTLTVDLRSTRTINRIIVDTQSQGSTANGLRAYTIAVQAPDGSWTTVGQVGSEFRYHERQIIFAPTAAEAVRITVTAVDFGGYYGGGVPPFWSASDPGYAFIHAVEVYGGQAAPRQAAGEHLAHFSTT